MFPGYRYVNIGQKPLFLATNASPELCFRMNIEAFFDSLEYGKKLLLIGVLRGPVAVSWGRLANHGSVPLIVVGVGTPCPEIGPFPGDICTNAFYFEI